MARLNRQVRVIELLEDNVRTEITIMNDMRNLGLSNSDVQRLMEGVTSSILYAFDVDWASDWVKPNGVHTWREAVGWFGRCPPLSTGLATVDQKGRRGEVGTGPWRFALNGGEIEAWVLQISLEAFAVARVRL
ncbi:hypothetical protein AB0A74_40650 [Saccharothrix sp. NPDC042600]|uniref:hypothetical protein n=1 Tax=Saccharothrix TaxID=2071 RepID=UPI00340AB410|nr:hypothetical protein GCM10017745_46590 [Saccharothrix mutabilis subsp. capreolus]